MKWMDAAACRQVDPELFFPIAASGPEVLTSERAIAVCDGCSVRRHCLNWALELRIPYGIWGGTTEQEREQLSRVAVSA